MSCRIKFSMTLSFSSFAGKTCESMPDREMDSAESRRVTKVEIEKPSPIEGEGWDGDDASTVMLAKASIQSFLPFLPPYGPSPAPLFRSPAGAEARPTGRRALLRGAKRGGRPAPGA
jgi:hypothetical protein